MADRKSRRRKRLVVLAVGVALIAGGGFGGKFALKWRRQQQAAQAYTRGMAAYRAGQHAQALPDLSRAASRIQNDPDLLYALADSRRRVPEVNSRHISAAVGIARAARDAAPADLRPRLLLLELYFQAGFVTESLAEANSVLAIDPTNADAIHTRISALVALGRTNDALTDAQRLMAASPDDIEALNVLVTVMESAGNPLQQIREEVALHAESLDRHPRYVVLQALLASRAGERDTAIALARTATSMDLNDAQAVASAVLLCDQLAAQDPTLLDQASAAIDAALSRPALLPEIAAFVLSRDWRMLQLASASTHIEIVVAQPDSLPTDALGWAAFLSRGTPGATSRAEALRAREDSPARSAWIATLDAHDAIDLGDLTAARIALDAARQAQAETGLDTPICPPADLADASLLLAAGDAASAESLLTRLGFERQWLIARVSLLELFLQQSRLRDVLAVLRADPLLTRSTSLPRSFAAAAASLIASHQVGPDIARDIQTFVQSLTEADPDDADLRVYRAIALAGIGRDDDARALLATVNTAQLSDRALVLRAASFTQGAQASADLGSLMANPPTSPGPLLEAALVVAAAVDPASGLAMFDRVTASVDAGRSAHIRICRAVFLDRVGDSRAREELVALANENPDLLPAQLALLESQSAWTADTGLDTAVARLRAIAGEPAASWRIFEARRLLRFDPAEAATARAFNLLSEASRTSWPNPEISDLRADAALRGTDPASARLGAIRHLTEGVQASPSGARLIPRLVLLLRAQGDAPAAAAQLDSLIALDIITPSLRLARADLALFLGRFQQALTDYRVLAEADASDDRARLGMANAQVGLGNWPEAEAIYDSLARTEQPNPQVLIDYANALAIYGHTDRGVALLARLPEQVNGQPRSAVLADYYARHAPPEQALAALRQMADNGDADSATRLAQFEMERGRPQQAVEVAQTYLARFPENERLREIRALARLGMGDAASLPIEDLTELARIAEARSPGSSYALLTKAMLDQANQTITRVEFLAQVQQVLRRDPTFMPAYATLVQAHLSEGRPSEAANVAIRAAEAVPENVTAVAMAARRLADASRFDEAQLFVTRWKALLRTPSPEPDLLLGGIALAQGQPQAARLALTGWLDQLSSDARESGANRPVLAAVLALSGRASDAAALFPAGQFSAADAADYFNASSLMVASSVPAAYAWDVATLDRFPEPEERIALAARLLSLGTEHAHAPSLTTCVQILEGLERDGHGTSTSASLLASAQVGLANTDQAVASYRQALARDPDDLMAMNNLAVILSRAPETASEAVSLARRTIDVGERLRLSPQVLANLLDTLGCALLANGDSQGASAAFARGLQLDPTSIGCQVGLVETLVAEANEPAARAALARINPTAVDGDAEVRTRLDRVRAAIP